MRRDQTDETERANGDHGSGGKQHGCGYDYQPIASLPLTKSDCEVIAELERVRPRDRHQQQDGAGR